MDRDTVVRLAKEAHNELVTKDYPSHLGQIDPWTMQLLTRFATLIANETLERAAKVCDEDEINGALNSERVSYNNALHNAANAIRSLKE